MRRSGHPFNWYGPKQSQYFIYVITASFQFIFDTTLQRRLRDNRTVSLLITAFQVQDD